MGQGDDEFISGPAGGVWAKSEETPPRAFLRTDGRLPHAPKSRLSARVPLFWRSNTGKTEI
ncbi:hypothetical protein EYF80_033052 [Liparis tanakae]|uniref:Uncharacterized protein n=1 Tax=Liparis tanakae TaxID=230148 RepID=A0A4Z2GSY6_9TELE|nr:hypothetical protein EYF80_033052 [Liparis tanakae]